MVETVDRYGLKKHFLKRHLKFVERFYRQIENTDFQSEAAKKCRDRFEKNRDKLFTFLEHDGVPWNNNNAEHGIKAFAALRDVMLGSSTQNGLDDYLILLSVCQTCKYSGVDFLDFLRSGEKDVHAFAELRRRRRAAGKPPPAIVADNNASQVFIRQCGRFDGGAFREPDPDFDELDDDAASEKDHTVADLAPRPKRKFVYEYDFGDGWLHDVTVEKVLPLDLAFQHPVCLAGKNACPPEDSGGIGGYYDLLKSLADPKRPEHDEVKAWLGADWDAAHFDIDEVNAALKLFKRCRPSNAPGA